MAKHTETSWKPDKPINQLRNSVNNATDAVKQALSHPSRQLIEQSYQAIAHAENGFINALQTEENQESSQSVVQELRAQLNQDRQLLQQLQPMKEAD